MRLVNETLPFFCLLFVVVNTSAQVSGPSDTPVDAAISVTDITGDNFLFSRDLYLDAAIDRALQNNLGFRRDMLNVKTAHNDVSSAEAAFDTTIRTSMMSSNSQQTGRITEDGLVTPDQETDNMTFNVSITKKLGTGAEIALATSANKLDSDFGTEPIAHTATTGLTLRIMQPLLGSSGAVANKAELESALQLASAAEHELERKTMSLATEIESLYWDLALAERVEKIRLDSVILARALVAKTENLFDRGRKSRLDVLEAKNGLAVREQELISVRYYHAKTAEILQLEISGKTNEESATLVVTRTTPETPSVTKSLAELEEAAVTFRSDLLQARDRLSASTISLDAARQNRRPNLDLTAMVGTGGTAERLQDAYDLLRENQSPRWSVGITFSRPFGNRRADAAFMDATINRSRTAIAVQELENNIRLEVRASYRNLKAAIRQLSIARRQVETSRELLEAARKRYELGMIDLYRLQESAGDAAESEVTLAQRRFEAAKVYSELRLAVGTQIR